MFNDRRPLDVEHHLMARFLQKGEIKKYRNQINTKQGAGFAAVWLGDFLHYSWRHTDLLRRGPTLCVGQFPWRLPQTFSQEIMLRVTNQKAMKTHHHPSAFVPGSSPFGAHQKKKK